MSSNNPNGNNIEDENFDFIDAVSSSKQSSNMTATLDLVKSVALSRPFLLAVIAFLLYKVWNTASAKSAVPATTGPSIVSVESVGGKTSIQQEKVSRKSQRNPVGIPPVTLAKK